MLRCSAFSCQALVLSGAKRRWPRVLHSMMHGFIKVSRDVVEAEELACPLWLE